MTDQKYGQFGADLQLLTNKFQQNYDNSESQLCFSAIPEMQILLEMKGAALSALFYSASGGKIFQEQFFLAPEVYRAEISHICDDNKVCVNKGCEGRCLTKVQTTLDTQCRTPGLQVLWSRLLSTPLGKNVPLYTTNRSV